MKNYKAKIKRNESKCLTCGGNNFRDPCDVWQQNLISYFTKGTNKRCSCGHKKQCHNK